MILSGGQRGPIKIGISKDPEQRVIDLQTGSPYPLVLFGFFQVGSYATARMLEFTVHAALASGRLLGEWFAVSPEDAQRTIADKAADLGYVVTWVRSLEPLSKQRFLWPPDFNPAGTPRPRPAPTAGSCPA
jgi:hypothetical protein